MSTPNHEKASTQQGKQNPWAQDQAKSRKDQRPIKQTKVKEKLKKKKKRVKETIPSWSFGSEGKFSGVCYIH